MNENLTGKITEITLLRDEQGYYVKDTYVCHLENKECIITDCAEDIMGRQNMIHYIAKVEHPTIALYLVSLRAERHVLDEARAYTDFMIYDTTLVHVEENVFGSVTMMSSRNRFTHSKEVFHDIEILDVVQHGDANQLVVSIGLSIEGQMTHRLQHFPVLLKDPLMFQLSTQHEGTEK